MEPPLPAAAALLQRLHGAARETDGTGVHATRAALHAHRQLAAFWDAQRATAGAHPGAPGHGAWAFAALLCSTNWTRPADQS